MFCIFRIEWKAHIHVAENSILRTDHIPKADKYAADIYAVKIGWAMRDYSEWRRDTSTIDNQRSFW